MATKKEIRTFRKALGTGEYAPDLAVARARWLGEIERRVQQARQEILQDVIAGTVPRATRSFSKLHDYTDANWYGGGFDDELSNEAGIAVLNEVQQDVHKWLASGGLKEAR